MGHNESGVQRLKFVKHKYCVPGEGMAYPGTNPTECGSLKFIINIITFRYHHREPRSPSGFFA